MTEEGDKENAVAVGGHGEKNTQNADAEKVVAETVGTRTNAIAEKTGTEKFAAENAGAEDVVAVWNAENQNVIAAWQHAKHLSMGITWPRAVWPRRLVHLRARLRGHRVRAGESGGAGSLRPRI